jgi:hypothetical protein
VQKYRREIPKYALRILLFLLLIIPLIAVLSKLLPPGVDWEKAYFPAARELVFLHNPYNIPGYFNPPWTLLPFLPLALLPNQVGRAIFFLMSLLGFGYAAHKLNARPLALGAFLASPPVMHCLLNANIDWMPLLGFVLPPRIGLFLLMVKPQVGIGVMLFWFVEAWRQGGVKETFRIFWPVTIVTLLSYLIFGFYPLRFGQEVDLWWNASLWPMSIPVGLGLLAAALRKREIRFAIGAGPCLSPYVLFHSWSGPLLAVVPNQWDTLAAVAGLWILVLIRAAGV